MYCFFFFLISIENIEKSLFAAVVFSSVKSFSYSAFALDYFNCIFHKYVTDNLTENPSKLVLTYVFRFDVYTIVSPETELTKTR